MGCECTTHPYPHKHIVCVGCTLPPPPHPMTELNRCNELFKTICGTYADNDFMLNKISRYLLNELSPKLRAENCDHESNPARESWFAKHAAHIKNSVITQQQFFYIGGAKQFVKYDGVDYRSTTFDCILTEVRDCIVRDIANSVSAPTTGLTEWKQNVGYEVLEEIQNVPLHETIPDSSTIQSVITSIYPSIFETRDEAKYFLTILGDSLMGKFPKMVYLTSPSVKPFIATLQRDISLVMGIQNSLSGIKYKYHDHVYAECRVMNVSAHAEVSHAPSPLNMFAVALHYSVRHNSGDEFATRYLCCDTTDRIFCLRDNTQQDIVSKFENDSIQRADPTSGSHITQKEMLFLWKNFLEMNKLPNVMFASTFLDIIGGGTANQGTNTDMDFPNKISKFLPGVSSFNSFWDECIVNGDSADEMEMDEITFLYRTFLSTTTKRPITLDANGIGRIMRHFHPNVSITQGKYVSGIRHKDWDKNKQVADVLDDIHDKLLDRTDQSHAIPFNVLYKQYTGCVNDGSKIVSKRFFESAVTRQLFKHVHNQSVSCTWWTI